MVSPLINLKSRIKTNSPKVRREILNGREHVVVPIRMMVSGVLNGSKGPLYYPQDEIGKDVESWNGMPITVYHPSRNGQNVSARDPEIINSQGIGNVYRTHNRKGPLDAEAWIDVERANKVDTRIIQHIEAKKSMELSTGLFTTNEPAPQGSVHNNKPYVEIARDYRPDHLAFLPDQVGACSLNDGCGVLVNLGNDQYIIEEIVDKLPESFLSLPLKDGEGFERVLDGVNNYKYKIRNVVANEGWVTLRGGTHIFIGKGGKVTKGPAALKGGGGGSSKGDSEDDYDNPSASLTKKIADSGKGKELEHGLDLTGKSKSSVTGRSADEGVKNAPLQPWLDKKYASSSHSVDLPKDPKKLSIQKTSEALDQMGYKLGGTSTAKTDLKTMKTSYEVTYPDGSKSRMDTKALKDLVYSAKKAVTNEQVDNGGLGSGTKPELVPISRDLGDETHADRPAITLQTLAKAFNDSGFVTSTDQDSRGVVISQSVSSVSQSLVDKGWNVDSYQLKSGVRTESLSKGNNRLTLTEEGSRTLAFATRGHLTTNKKEDLVMAKLTDADREKLVVGLTTNCKCQIANTFSEDDREYLEGLEDNKLQQFAANRKKLIEAEAIENTVREVTGNKTLTANAMPDFIKKKMAAKEGEEEEPDGDEPVVPVKNSESKKAQTDAEWLKSAPPGIRSAVQNAQRIEAKEKKDLIEKLTANVSDEAKQERLIGRYEGMDIEALRDIADALPEPTQNQEYAPRNATRMPLYAGSGAPIGNRATLVANRQKQVQDDIAAMTPPTLNYEEISKANTGRLSATK